MAIGKSETGPISARIPEHMVCTEILFQLLASLRCVSPDHIFMESKGNLDLFKNNNNKSQMRKGINE